MSKTKGEMLMKKILLAAAFCLPAVAMAVTKPRIYLNPGHGGWSPNDRPLPTIPYPMLESTGRPDTCGFYESNTNLWKTEEMGRILQATDEYTVRYSRRANGPYPWVEGASDEARYDRVLSVIAAEVDNYRADYFISVHSNAASDGALANYPLFLYRGTDAEEAVKNSKDMCSKMWPFHVEAMKADFEYMSAYTSSKNIRGDRDFYNYTWINNKGYSGYLGVLMHGCPGYLVEGYFHTYQPSRHRALNPDWCRMEGRRYARGIISYFGTTPDSLGCIMGAVRSKTEKSDNLDYYAYASDTQDAYLPLNGATVRLKDSNGNVLKVYEVDEKYNGIFVFTDLEPGIYYVDLYCPGYRTQQTRTIYTRYQVKANSTTYKVHSMTVGTSTPLTPIPDAIESVAQDDPRNAGDKATVRLYDTAGQLVLTTTRAALESCRLPSGVYVMESAGRSVKYYRR
ncbi:MAG: N-acetylmuramoyl-L-alanine amidase [Bacteroidaceae bacterium]